MTDPVIGWMSELPAPNVAFNHYLSSRDGRLFLDNLDLTQLFLGDKEDQGLGRTLPSPLEIVYLPLIRQKIEAMRRLFAEAIDEIGYEGKFLYAYASKANAAEEVIRTTLGCWGSS